MPDCQLNHRIDRAAHYLEEFIKRNPGVNPLELSMAAEILRQGAKQGRIVQSQRRLN